MASCVFCGLDAGAGSDSHGACVDVYSYGKKWITSMIGAFVSNERELRELEYAITLVAKFSYLSASQVRSVVMEGYKLAIDQALEDHLLSDEEERCLEAIEKTFGLTKDELHKADASLKLLYARIIRHIREGNLFEYPTDDMQLPFNVQRSEIVVWLFANVDYYEQRTRSRVRIGQHEVSAELASLYLRSSELTAEVVEDEQMVRVDKGAVGITSKHIYFAGSRKQIRISYNDIVGFTPYTDGIGVTEDGRNRGSHVFLTKDGWFTYNLVVNLARHR